MVNFGLMLVNTLFAEDRTCLL